MSIDGPARPAADQPATAGGVGVRPSTESDPTALEPRSLDDTQDLPAVGVVREGPGAADTQPNPGVPTIAPADTPPSQPVTDSVWRYHLDVLVGESAGAQVWQATDPVLGRRVGVRLLPVDDPRASDLREAACLAARVADSRLIHVLDVVDVRFEDSPHVAVVTEWVSGRSLTEVLQQPMDSTEALRICAEVAECLEAAHAEGIAHGRLRPASILLTDNGGVRVRGIGVDAVLRGCDPDPDPALSDVHGVGALLYACVTARWPYGELDTMAAAPQMGGGVPIPGRVAPSVSGRVNALCASSVAGCSGPRDTVAYTRLSDLSRALRSAASAAAEAPAAPRTAVRARRVGRRLVATVIGVLAVAGLALLGWQLVSKAPAALTSRPSSSPPPIASASPSASPKVTARVDKALPIIRISDFDPLGNGSEHPDQVSLAIDGDIATAWTTTTYNEASLSGKEGVGLLLDLGTPRPISAVKLTLVGKGTDVEVRTAEQPKDDPAAFSPFGAAAGAPGQITLRSPTPVTARYVLLWLTKLPAAPDGGGFQGGVSEVSVLG